MLLKISSVQTFCFCSSNVTTFPTSRKCKNFNFSLYTVPVEMLYLQKYLSNFQKFSFSWKMRKVAIVVENFKCTDILVSQKQRYHFSNIQKMQNFQFLPLECPSRNAESSKVFNELSKTFVWLKDAEGGYCGWKFQVYRHFAFSVATLPLFQHPENVKISIFPFTLSQQKCYNFKSIWQIFKNVFWLKDEEGGYSGWKFPGHRHFAFEIATLPLFHHPKYVKKSIFPFTLSQEKWYISKVFNEFSKTFFCPKDAEGGYCCWKFQVYRHFAFSVATLPLFHHPENVKISIFPFTLSRQKCYIFKSI